MKTEKIEFKFEWNWIVQMKSIILLLENGNSEGKKYAKKELMDLAEKLANYNELKSKN